MTLEQKTKILDAAGKLMVAYLQAKPRVNNSITIGSPDAAEILRCLPAACSVHGVPYVAADWPLDMLANLVEPPAPRDSIDPATVGAALED